MSSARVLKARDVVFADDFVLGPRSTSSAAAQEAALAEAYERGLHDGQQDALSALPTLVAGLVDAVRDTRRAPTCPTDTP